MISSKKKVLENYDCDDDNYDNNEKYNDIRNDSNDITTTTTTNNNNNNNNYLKYLYSAKTCIWSIAPIYNNREQ